MELPWVDVRLFGTTATSTTASEAPARGRAASASVRRATMIGEVSTSTNVRHLLLFEEKTLGMRI